MNSDFKAAVVAEGIQKGLANKILANKTLVKSLIDDKTANLLDNLYLLLYVFVSSYFVKRRASDPIKLISSFRQRTKRNLRRQLKILLRFP